MNLLEFITKHENEEITVWDKDYDMETYFYTNEETDYWDKAINKIASKLEVIEYDDEEFTATVNLYEIIEKNIDNFKQAELFCSYDIEDIMEDMESIFAGGVTEKWLVKFADAIE